MEKLIKLIISQVDPKITFYKEASIGIYIMYNYEDKIKYVVQINKNKYTILCKNYF